MAVFKDVMSASEHIESDVGVYAKYTIETKFPNVLDGLKPIHRRILLKIHELGGGVKKELTVSGKVVEMHPHGDASINSAISVMAQPFSHTIPLVFSESNIGNYDGDDPAGARYVDVSESEVAKALFFTDVNPDMYKMVPCESESDFEPAYLIPRIPTALAIRSFAIAIGFQSNTMIMSVPELCKAAKEYIRIRADNVDWIPKVKKQLVKYMLPDFPTACSIRNSRELLNEFRKGNFDAHSIIDGTMRITKDEIIIYTLPPDKSFREVTFDVGMERAKNPSSWENQNFMQMEDFAGKKQGIMNGNFHCVVRRGVNPFDVLARLKKAVQFTSNWSPERHYVTDDGVMTVETPFTLMDKWYETRNNAVVGDLKQTLKNMVDRKRILLALIIVRDHAKEVFNIFHAAGTTEQAVPELVKRFNLTKYQASFLAGLKFAQITAKGKADLQKDLDQLEIDMEELQKKFSKVPDIMIHSIEQFENKFVVKPFQQGSMTYDLSRRCLVRKYVGAAIYKDNGYMLMESEEEMDQVLKDFTDPDTIEFKLFGPFGEVQAIGADEDFEGDVPKYIKSSYVDRISTEKYTGCICNKGGAMVCEGLIPKLENMKSAVPIDRKFIAVDRTGHCSYMTVDAKIIRKSPSAGATMKDVVHIANGGTDIIVIHGNSSQANNLVIERLDLSNGPAKLHKIPVGQWMILNVISPCTKRVYVNIPKELRQRCATRHLVFDDLGSIIKPGEKLNCVFGRNTIKSDFKFVPLRKKSLIVLAKPE